MRSKQLSLEKYPTDKHDWKVIDQFIEEYDQILEPWVHKNVKVLELGIYKGGSLMLWRDYFPLGTIVGIDIKVPENFSPGDRIYFFEGEQTDTEFLSRVANETAPDGFDIIIDDASHIGEFTKRSFWYLFDHHLKPGGLYVIEDWLTGYVDNWLDGKKLKHKMSIFSRLRSRLRPHLRFFIKVHRENERRFSLKSQSRMMCLYNYSARVFIKLATRCAAILSPASLKTGLLPPFNLLLRTPFETHCYGMVGFIKQLIDEQGESERQSKISKMTITKYMVFVHKAISQP